MAQHRVFLGAPPSAKGSVLRDPSGLAETSTVDGDAALGVADADDAYAMPADDGVAQPREIAADMEVTPHGGRRGACGAGAVDALAWVPCRATRRMGSRRSDST